MMNKDNEYKIVVQNPTYIFDNQERNFNGYNFKFLELYSDGILLYRRPWKYFQYKKKLRELGWNKKIYLSARAALSHSDALVCFNGRAYLSQNKPPRQYKKKKFFHTMDFSDNILKSSKALKNADYLMGYCNHDVYSPFFRKYFSAFTGKVIRVPFGYGARFFCKAKVSERINKCIALGSVNPVADPLMATDALLEYKKFYSMHEYSHEVRRAIQQNCDQWQSSIESKLPVYPETKNNAYDAVEELNKYTMFINDASIDEFPPARTYEGIACGCIMVAEDLGIYKELGFEDGKNCVLFEKGNYDMMIEKINYYIQHIEKLENMQRESLKLAKNFSHDKVAKKIYQDIANRINGIK